MTGMAKDNIVRRAQEHALSTSDFLTRLVNDCLKDPADGAVGLWAVECVWRLKLNEVVLPPDLARVLYVRFVTLEILHQSLCAGIQAMATD